jgi:hypothetical protein
MYAIAHLFMVLGAAFAGSMQENNKGNFARWMRIPGCHPLIRKCIPRFILVHGSPEKTVLIQRHLFVGFSY